MNEIEQIAVALEDAGMKQAAYQLRDVIGRQHQRRGITPWTPAGKLPVQTMAETVRNWVRVFDIPIYYREWPQVGYSLLLAVFKLEARYAS
jgi:hypothetical protein